MTTKQKLITGAAVLIVVYIGSEYVQRKNLEQQIITAPILKETENQKIIVDTNKKKVTVVKRGPIGKGKDGKSGTEVTKVTEGARKVVITEDRDGTIRVVALNKGFCFEPGLALYYSDSARLGLDVQLAYYKRWGVLLGAGVNMGEEPRTIRAHVAVNYALPLSFMDNTSMFLGMDHKKEVVAGARLRF